MNLAPPVEVAAAAAAPSATPSPTPVPAVVNGHDFGTSVKVALAISPGTAGFDTFSATVTDYDSGAPVAADGVSMRFVFPARSDVGSSRLDLAPSGPGVFTAAGTNLSLDGTWHITVVVAFDAAGSELPVPAASMALGLAGGQLAPLAPRELEPGHFVADTTLIVGTYSLSISGPAPGGDQVTTQLDIPVTR